MNGVVYASYSLRMEGQLELSSVALPMNCVFSTRVPVSVS